MKKILAFIIVALSFTFTATAQEDEKVKVKKTTTIPQKVINPLRKHNRYKGYKAKHKYPSGHKHVKKVNTMNGKVKTKSGN